MNKSQKMFSKQLDFVNTATGSTDRQELITSNSTQANLDLEKALENYDKELERLVTKHCLARRKGSGHSKL